MTQLESITDAVLAALNTARPAGVPEHREWSGLAVEAATLPVGTVVWGTDVPRRIGGRQGPLTQHTIPLLVEYLTCGAATPTPISPQRAAEPLRAWAIKKLETNKLGGLVMDIAEAPTERKLEQGQVPFARTIIQFDVTYTTRVADAEQRV